MAARGLDEAIDELDAARLALAATLEDLGKTLEGLRGAMAAGEQLSDAHAALDVREARERVSRSVDRFNTAFRACRAAGVRRMVDDEGMSLVEVARRLRLSRQFVSRLYAASADSAESGGN